MNTYKSLIFKLILIILCLLYVFIFIFYFANKFNKGTNKDFLTIYLSTIAWSEKKNPYNHDILADIWITKHDNSKDMPDFKLRPSVYPIVTFPIFYYFSYFDWHQAIYLINIINLISIIALIIVLILIFPYKLNSYYFLILILLILSLGPIRDCIGQGNPALLSFTFLLYAFYCNIHNYNKLSGILLGISICLKPQIGIALLFYFILYKKVVSIIVSAIFIFIILLISLHFDITNLQFIFSFVENLRSAFSPGGVNDTSSFGFANMSIISLDKLFNYMPSLLSKYFKIILFIGSIYIIIKNIKSDNFFDKLLSLSTIITFSLLFIYHRYADGLLIIIPMILGIELLKNNYTNYYIFISIFGWLPFLLCLPIQVDLIIKKYNALNWLSKPIFSDIIMLYQPVSVLILYLFLLYLMYQNAKKKLNITTRI